LWKSNGSLFLDGRERIKGDIDFQIRLAEDDKDDYERLKGELRKQSQVERGTVFWIIPVNERIDKEVSEVFRSKEMITKKERGAQTAASKRDCRPKEGSKTTQEIVRSQSRSLNQQLQLLANSDLVFQSCPPCQKM